MKNVFASNLLEIERYERKVLLEHTNPINLGYEMITYLQNLLTSVKKTVLSNGFKDQCEEIFFFRNIKPHILGKLIFYNQVVQIETACPVPGGKIYTDYFAKQLDKQRQKFSDSIYTSDFYRYYKSGRTDKDAIYFTTGNIDYYDGLKSFVFELNEKFSTYYDIITAQIIANESIYEYLMDKFLSDQDRERIISETAMKDVFWTASKNALIELIYALIASGAISHGKTNIRKVCNIFQIVFKIELEDIHNAFHRMKTRSNNKTIFLDHLKRSLEQYMDKNI